MIGTCRRFLERKKLQKKKGRGGPEAGQVLVPAELRLKEQQATTSARFGEVADAPLKVSSLATTRATGR